MGEFSLWHWLVALAVLALLALPRLRALWHVGSAAKRHGRRTAPTTAPPPGP